MSRRRRRSPGSAPVPPAEAKTPSAGAGKIKSRNPIARIIKGIPQQVIPDKRRRQKHKPNHPDDWACPFLHLEEWATLP